jgi:hypothetical protein
MPILSSKMLDPGACEKQRIMREKTGGRVFLAGVDDRVRRTQKFEDDPGMREFAHFHAAMEEA